MEAFADLMEYVMDNAIAGNIAVHSDSRAAIARVGHIGPGPGQGRAIRVVKAVKHRLTRGWHTSMVGVSGHTGFIGNERADILAGQVAPERRKGRTSIPWLKERISQHYTMATDQTPMKERRLFCHQALRSHSWIVLRTGLREQLRRFEQGTSSLQRILKGLGKIATRIYPIYAGGVVGSGCPGPMSFFDVPTRIWKMQGPQFGTAREKMVKKDSGQNLWVNF
jgi:hypothetical protein